MKTPLLFVAALVLSACATAPQAGSLVEVSVIDRSSGETLALPRHEGKLYVAGVPGRKYAVALRNRSSGRVLTVLSVDGVNAVTGETAAVSQNGYVLDGYERSEITGWRKSLDEVAAFVFAPLSQSYAGKTGRAEHVGVIGVAVFRERVVAMLPKASPPVAEESLGAAESRAAAPARRERLGTGHGERETSVVSVTEFRRASDQPGEVIRIYYDSYANLVARGVIRVLPPHVPDPFPGRFVPDPVG